MFAMSKGEYNIYFSASIAGGRRDAPIYSSLVKYLEEYHGTVLDKHVGDPCLTVEGEGDISHPQIYRQDLEWLIKADVVVAEVTTPSWGAGFEAGYFVKLHENDLINRILGLYRLRSGKILSAMCGGCDKIVLKNYDKLEEAYQHIDDFFRSLPPPSQLRTR